MQDKTFWKNILENKGEIPDGVSQTDLTTELLDYLRSPDPELRDEFGYQILAHWIISGVYDEATLKGFLDRWLNDLTTGLGEIGTDSVLTRSFSALMLSILVYYDIKQPWLSSADYGHLYDEIITYFIAEKDLRGYDSEKGWHHATAHTADALKFLARNEKSDAEHLQGILDAVAIKLTQAQKHIYTHGEDERLALVILDVVKRDLLNDEVYSQWLARLVSVKDQLKPTLALDEEAFAAAQNVTHFLRALYFTLSKHQKTSERAGRLAYQVFAILSK